MNAGLLCNLKKNYNTHNQFILRTIYVPFFVWKRTQLPITRQLLEEECRNTWNILYKVEYHIITCWIPLHSQKPINHHKKKENVLDQKNYLHISIWCMHITLSSGHFQENQSKRNQRSVLLKHDIPVIFTSTNFTSTCNNIKQFFPTVLPNTIFKIQFCQPK